MLAVAGLPDDDDEDAPAPAFTLFRKVDVRCGGGGGPDEGGCPNAAD